MFKNYSLPWRVFPDGTETTAALAKHRAKASSHVARENSLYRA